jgi:hypothetical protein
MKAKNKVIVEAGTIEEFLDRIRRHATVLDRGEPVTPGIRISFADPEEMETYLIEFRRTSSVQ